MSNQGTASSLPAPYDSLAISLHWLTTGLVITLFCLAEFWDFAPRPAKHLMVVAHMSLGILLALTLVTRIAWRLSTGRKIQSDDTGLFALAAKAMHYALYVLLVAQVGLGFMMAWTDNRPLSFFGLPIPSPFGTFSKATNDLVDRLHDINAWTIIILASCHALAALFHHFVLKDDVLGTMLPVVKQPRSRL